MRILELEISNIRGVRHLRLQPAGETTVIFGPNGSGKSTVIDALDFLLTGTISRLQGSGTRGITLKEHGKHVDATPREAFVRATVKLPNHDDPVEIVRRMARPKDIEVDDTARPDLERVLTLAGRRQHVLTRRELLRYITADGSTRAKAVEELLDLHELKPIQNSLKSARKTFKGEQKQAEANVAAARRALAQRLELQDTEGPAVLERINALRATLDAPALPELAIDGLLGGAPRPRSEPDAQPRHRLAAKVHKLQARLSSGLFEEASADFKQLAEHLAKLEADTDLRRRVEVQQLLEAGHQLLDGGGACPLCETEFAPGSLAARLEERIEAGQRAAQDLATLRKLSSSLRDRIRTVLDSVDAVLTDTEQTGSTASAASVAQWADGLRRSLDRISAAGADREPLSADDEPQPPSSDVLGELSTLASEADVSSEPTPQERAWDTLTAAKEDLRRLADANEAQVVAAERARVACVLYDQFQDSRGRVVSTLYDKVRERFEGLYRTMNDDESDFSARLEPDGSSLDFTVDFHQRGQNPPHALHSEGHQDSMGLCLYLALAERLNRGVLDVVLLDDVVMSVDAGHRREFCRLLKDAFPGRQFIITTHDTVWAKQLRTEGVVRSKHLLEFGGWDIDHGPRVAQSDLWAEIDAAMERGDVPEAAWRLRRGLEEFFGGAAERLGAKVTYRSSGQYAMEEVLAPAHSRLGELLKRGKEAANSWNNKAGLEQISAMSEQLAAAQKLTNIERWGVNASVHYNAWADLSATDFRPVLEAFRGLCAAFECSQCQAPLRLVAESGPLTCACGQMSVALEKKRKG